MEALMILLLAWQTFMPAVENGHYQVTSTKNGDLVRINTQNGTLQKCTPDLKCEETTKEEPKKDELSK